MKFGEFIFDVLSKGVTGTLVRKTDNDGNLNYQISPVFGQQGQTPPLVAYAMQNINPAYHKNGKNSMTDFIRFSCDCVELTQDKVQTLSAAVRADLEGATGTHGTLKTSGIWLVNEVDLFDVEVEYFVKTLSFEGLFI